MISTLVLGGRPTDLKLVAIGTSRKKLANLKRLTSTVLRHPGDTLPKVRT